MRSPLKSTAHQKAQAQRTERKLAHDLNGRATPNSGAIDGMKGDVTTDKFLLDSKETGAKSIVISAAMLNKISKEAREAGKRPGIVITLGRVALGTARQWALVPIQDFQEMTDG